MLEIGSSLREARRLRNVELAEVERATRIRVQQLEALEQERFEQLPPDPYRRSFLREYADFLGLDSDLYTSEYDLRFHPPAPPLTGPPPRRRAGANKRLLVALGAIVVAAFVALGVWQLGGSGGTRTVARTTPPASTAQAPAQPPVTTAPSTSASAPQLLVLTAARGSCWLLVRVGSAGGPIVYQQILQAGHTVRFGLRRALWIRIGAPWSLDAAIGRQPVMLPAHVGNVVATAVGLQSAP